MTHRLPLMVALSVFAFAATAARHADACPCQPMPLAPAEGSTIPENATAFPFQLRAGIPVAYPRLLDALGAERATTVTSDPSWPDGSLLFPAEPLPVGAGYQIVYNETCGTSDERRHVFDVGPKVPSPTSIGSLTASNWSMGPIGGCMPPSPSPLTAVFIDLVIPASPAMIAWAPLTSFRVTVDGADARLLPYGAVQPTGGSFVVTRLSVLCDADTWRSGELTLGAHDISVIAHVAGAASDPPPVSRRIRFSCSDSHFDQVAEDHDAGGASDGGGTGGGASSDGGVTGTGTGNAAASDETVVAGCGCSTIGAAFGRSSALSGFGVLSLLAMAAFRRRRRSLGAR